MPKNERYIVGLDIGTTKIACVVAELGDKGAAHVVGIGAAPSRGIRRDVIVNPDATVDAVKAAVEEAELMAGVNVESALVGVAGSHVRSFNSRGVIGVTGKNKTVSRDDYRRVLEAARAVTIPQDREVVHVLPQEFVLDDQPGISKPLGMTGSHLEANVHIVTAATSALQNLVTCVNRAGIEVRDTVLEPLAIAESVLSEDEKELGVALIDVGGGTTDLAIFEKKSLWHTGMLPVGGDHFTNDLAVGLRTPIPDAERVKRKYGCALATLVMDEEAIEVPSVGGRPPRLLSRQVMAEILQPRAEEVFTLLHEEVKRAGFDRLLNAGVVLTGGASLLPGMVEVAEQVFDVPVRLGPPGDPALSRDGTSGFQFAAATGLALYGTRYGTRDAKTVPVPVGPLLNIGRQVRRWFAEKF